MRWRSLHEKNETHKTFTEQAGMRCFVKLVNIAEDDKNNKCISFVSGYTFVCFEGSKSVDYLQKLCIVFQEMCDVGNRLKSK